MHCYVCAEHGIERAAVGLCRSCYAGLCLEHLRDTAARLSGNVLAGCDHDTWASAGTAHVSSTDRPARHRALA
jgi:hypothetical protein